MIRKAEISDLDLILEITNDAILNTNAIYEEDPWDTQKVEDWYSARINAEFPVFVIETNNQEVVGFASYSKFRGRMGYRYTVEHSVYVHKNHRGEGYGQELLEFIIKDAEERGFQQMIGVVDATNEKSINFHIYNGFKEAGKLENVGVKFGRKLSICLLQRTLKP